MRNFRAILLASTLVLPAGARQESGGCGTSPEGARQSLFLHRQIGNRVQPRLLRRASTNTDAGNIAIIQGAAGVVDRLNQFNLDSNTLTFTPAAPNAAQYRYAVASGGYDSAAAANGSPLLALDDDDTRAVSLPFPFPFFGAVYRQVFVNSDGNLTFTAGDSASTGRTLGRMTAGPPRIAPLFDDLDPSKTTGGVRVLADATRVVVSWVKVPEYSASGNGTQETFQAKLYPDGRIEYSYNGVGSGIASAVAGIAPGNLAPGTQLVDFRGDASNVYAAAVAEVFANALDIDVVTAAQRFYETHDDAYDYLAIYNDMGIAAGNEGAVAYAEVLRSAGSGYGMAARDLGGQYGSPSRLKTVLNMGMVTQYPADPNGIVPARAPQGDTPLTILTHEAGHLFLAYASTADGAMLGFQAAHWSFLYNSEASVMEGERIADRGANGSPEFLTTDTVQGYSPLDQYLMGLRAPSEVPDSFLVSQPAPAYAAALHPLRNIGFDGTRVNVGVNDVMQAQGPRIPDSTVAQHRFRFAFVLVTAPGNQPSAAELQEIDTWRRQFESFYAQASSNRASADTALKRQLTLSPAPAAGVVLGGSATAAVTVSQAPASDLIVQLNAPAGFAKVPASVTIPAGAITAPFTVGGARAGVEEVQAVPANAAYETAYARIAVADAPVLRLTQVSGPPGSGPLVVRLTDANNLAYPGAHILAQASTGGSVTPATAVADAQGLATFQWTPGAAASNQLRLTVEQLPSVALTIQAGSSVPAISAVANAASFAAGITPGALETLSGVNLAGGRTAQAKYPWPTSLAGVSVTLNGALLPLLYVSDTQINFYVPPTMPQGPGTLVVTTPSGATAAMGVTLASLEPGIFAGAILHAGTAISAVTTPVRGGDFIEIYCTGLGPTIPNGGFQQTVYTPTIFIGGAPVTPLYSGLAPGYAGLYQVDVQTPFGLRPGSQEVMISVKLTHSNIVDILVQ